MRRCLFDAQSSFQIQLVITDSKLSLVQIGDMRMFLDRLGQAGEKFNVSELETLTQSVAKRSEELFKAVSSQKNMLLDMKTELLRQR